MSRTDLSCYRREWEDGDKTEAGNEKVQGIESGAGGGDDDAEIQGVGAQNC